LNTNEEGTVAVTSAPALATFSLSPAKLGFITKQNMSPASQNITITAIGQISWYTSGAPSWLSISPTGGSINTGSTVLTVSINPSNLTVGVYTGIITFTAANAANSPQQYTVTLSINDFDTTTISIDGTGNPGQYSSIALDSNNNPHIAYYAATAGDLRLTEWTGNSWNTQTIDSTGNVGKWVSLYFESGNPETFYYDTTNTALKTAEWTGGGWNIVTIDNTADVGQYASAKHGETNNSINVAYYDATNGDLKFARWMNGWDYQAVDTTGDVGKWCSLALDSIGTPYIAYYDVTNQSLKLTKYVNSTWITHTVDNFGNVGQYCSLQLDKSNNPHIAYYDANDGDLQYASWTGTTWDIQLVDQTNDVGKWCSLVLDSNDKPYIAYYDTTYSTIRLAKTITSNASIANVWTNTVISYSSAQYISSALDTNGNIYVSYYDAVNPSLKFTKLNNFTSGGPIGTTGTDLSKIYAYPVPFFPGSGNELTITNLTPTCDVEIYSITGMKIESFSADGSSSVKWDGTDGNNEYIGTGTYIITVKDNNKKYKFKILVIK
jgi:hypothetical protein